MAHGSGSSSGFTVGVGMTGGGKVGVGGGFSSQKTGIAKLTQPPKNENDDTGSSIAFIFIAIFIFNFVGGPASLLIAWILGREMGDIPSWLAGMFVGAVAAIVFVVWSRRHTDAQKRKGEAAHKAALTKWNHSWICLRCGNSFYVR